MRRRCLTAALCCGAAALAGCGSSHSGTTGTGASAGPAAVFASSLNALCKQANARAKTLTLKGDKTDYLQFLETYLRKYKALSAPPAQKAAYARYVRNFETEISDFKSGNSAAGRSLVGPQAELAKELGAPACT